MSGLRMSYGPREVLKGLDFEVRRGEVVALLGPNGAGKTTTIEILEGFRKPSDGEVRVLGESPLTADETWRSRVGVVLQSWRDHGRWQVRELLEQFGSYYAPYATSDHARPYDTDELLERVGLTPQAGSKVKSLSGGQRRRLDVAIGIVGRPEMLFLDEPTVGFDPVARRDFHALVHRLSDLEDTTILLTTHDLNEAEKLADRILILNHGRIVADGSAASLAEQISGTTEVRWTHHGEAHVHTTADGTAFVRDLLARHPDGIADLEVRRSTLEDTYLAMVARHEESEEPREVVA
ncbi:ABC transporter ATP-binding protein [Aeromicrobium choanae]|uniref:ABC-2 type transport system ATP-binding protein n=1 Tax=Aeromicrobium choanae TaxID=1736691 RepID=A0A1T4Z5B9_9ACTN|nr:ABC transporter ATP-binding protein [Aeromicrobium choanae]SKB09199.1 ABC-2 type transport system ATP-binding protein [Aeromicrobium choanae]